MFKKILLTVGSVLFSINLCASEPLYDKEIPLLWSSIITISGGPSWAVAGQNQYIYPLSPVYIANFNPNLPPNYYLYYTYDSPTSVLANGEIFFGLQRAINPWLTGQLGLGVAGVSNAEVTGHANLNGLLDVYTYDYKVNHARIEMKGKLIGSSFNPVQPYISGSFGAAFNNSHDYRTTSINQFLFPAPWYASNTTIAFAYSVGTGLQMMLSPHWQVGMGYEFADLGKSFLGGDGVNITKGLRLTHLYNNQLLFSLSYLYS
ncbi:hypothetical protein EP47_09815 [Legionella norrlandica]|uniref:Outer membrane protein beta-barrel domain-containing protein n=1 Tax=Legionella norrlandica TaxID=1498499 RepID=A0A0A2SQB3_9GAMM|nr:outer membrane beta-barrel protein [Legionella norrlandica]KGP62917.1 hypothetical protein EP47_09815 [Legionella norrlandica]